MTLPVLNSSPLRPRDRLCFLIRGAVAAALLQAPLMLPAQTQTGTLTGTVTSSDRQSPVESANVFLEHTTIGTATGPDGRYFLSRIPPGMHHLVISQVGYEPQAMEFQIGGGDTLTMNVELVPKVLGRGEVQVFAHSATEWQKLLRGFTAAFLGSGPNAEYSRIMNPEVVNLHIDPETDNLIATSDSTLRVENDALGYRLSIILTSFSWDLERDIGRYQIFPRFEEMRSSDEAMRKKWHDGRENSYRGSMKAFFAALVAGTVEAEGFEVHSGPLMRLHAGADHPVEPGEIVVNTIVSQPFVKIWFEGWLRVDYRGSGSRRSSYIKLNKDFALTDARGVLMDPLSFDVAGAWSKNRVADMLPLEYPPDDMPANQQSLPH